MKVLMITCEWPSIKNPYAVPFLVQQISFLREKGIEVEVFAFRGRKNPINYINAWISLQKMIKDKKYDLVHAQFGQSATLALAKKLPLVITFRGSDLEGIVSKKGKYTLSSLLLRKLSIFLAKKANKVIVVSKSLMKYLPNKQDIHIIPSGIDLELFKPIDKVFCRKTLGWDLDAKYILFAGSSSRMVKNYKLAEQSVKLLKKHVDVKLMEMSNIIHSRVPIYLNACDCLLLTSHHEGSPNVIKEAMACNIPIVSVNVGDVEERIGGIAGNYVSRTKSPEEIAFGLEKVLKNQQNPNNRLHTKNLSEHVTIQKLVDLYHEIATSSTSYPKREQLVFYKDHNGINFFGR